MNHSVSVAILLMTVAGASAGLYNINITKVDCIADEYYCQDSVCSGIYRSTDPPMFNFSCTFPTTYTSLKMRMVTYYKYTVYRKSLIDHTEDLCAFLENRGHNPLLQIFGDYTMKYSSFEKKKCPFENGTYSFINLPLNLDLLPPSFPDGQYRFDFHLSNQFKSSYFLTQIYLTLRSKRLF
ncbi:uncharacterized protein LOC129790942 [Lutzomyia longipalpis]|uniref:uncharacterized protein LOC129790942 n=1 Tax=Lutzomyia longipalpis TaxID=7200 RepID=UPI0024846D91|nr:uncharacterized protein LOC129790942 [Lutzomyia longipalpis]